MAKKRFSKQKLKKFVKQHKETLLTVAKASVIAVLAVLIAIPFLRTSNPGNTYGIDVSYHNGKIAWSDVSENGIAFAVIRCGVRSYSSGEIKEDSQFKRNMHSAWFHHVDRGVYFYSQAVNTEEAKEEAEATLRFLHGATLALPVFIDVEDTGTGGKGRADDLTKAERTAVVLAFSDVVREEGYTPGVYANKWFLEQYLDPAQLQATGIKIWLAEYNGKARPSYSAHYDYWQYSKTGTVPGISGEVDLNRTSKETDALAATSE